MAFESLSERLSTIFQGLSGKGKLSEDDVNLALKEVRMALLEADVNFKLVKDFVAKVKEKAIGEEVFSSLSPAQTVIKIVKEELTAMMGEENTELKLRPQSEITVLMMVGLQGAGKTTTAAKLAGKFQKMHRKPLLVACDIYRPAAIEQLRVNAEKLSIPFFSLGNQIKPEEIAQRAYEEAKEKGYNLLILDTAGRLQIDDALMQELKRMKAAVPVDWTILTVDAMTGQEAVNVSQSFSEDIGVDGVILTKCDGDTRGGAALSIKAMTGQPILFLGMGEKLSELEPFYPDRMAGRILGMGDVLSLIEKAQSEIDEEKARESVRKLSKGQFNYDDFMEQMNQLQKLGGIAGILKMLPGMNKAMQGIDLEDSEKKMKQVKCIIQSMTFKERANPKLMNPSRKKRIASGAGVDISEVNKLVKQFEEMQKMMKQFGGGRGKHGSPFGGGFPGMGMKGMGGKGFPF
ncbi:signal recognition particle protein [Oribacterium parvum ACB1]|uniref:Signal recognition particle protein n=1 Tax=Oribacterium parvum ACB1 TaxID=796943 RepID=G9WM59_9FIRM|nr:signal recognition particle protein [Oribacterium parvum]EHL12405.1 signal recognition particle protein [Oribacterium parvum ACB1]EJF12729.1 signal recognition particle protein [Oribacterium parvum ACB8]